MNQRDTSLIVSEWTNSNAAGSDLYQDSKQLKDKDALGGFKKTLSWYDNPKFLLSFEAKEKIPEIEFTIKLARSEFIWSKKISSGIVNSMIGLYIFHYDIGDNWKRKTNQLHPERFELLPKNEIVYRFVEKRVDPRGYILMPCTQGAGVLGPFSILVKCKEPFNLSDFSEKK